MKVLGIETSCDESSASIIEYSHNNEIPFRVLSLATHSQTEVHEPYGGVVPELASRDHVEKIIPMIDRCLTDAGLSLPLIDAIAVTARPGLVGALFVGVSVAKTLAYCFGKPVIPVDHMEGHLMSAYLDLPNTHPLFNSSNYPCLALTVSGGHTSLHLLQQMPEFWPENVLKSSQIGRSRDDAAGEAFDKTAKILGFPYPGGIWIERSGSVGDPQKFAFSRALKNKDTFDFSFSGLKTAVALKARELNASGALESSKPDMCASIQFSIVDALTNKISLAIERFSPKSLLLVGGVSANKALREKVDSLLAQKNTTLKSVIYPNLKYCTDNAAMIAAIGAIRGTQGKGLRGEELMRLSARATAQ